MKLIDDIHFDNSFSFIFSPRPGTPAAGLHDDTPHDVKLRRLQHLQSVINANIKSISESRGARCSAFWWKALQARCRRADGPHRMQPRGQLCRPARLVGQMVDVTITEARPTPLRGEGAGARGRPLTA